MMLGRLLVSIVSLTLILIGLIVMDNTFFRIVFIAIGLGLFIQMVRVAFREDDKWANMSM